VRVRLDKWEIVRLRLAATAAFLTLRRAAARCFRLAISASTHKNANTAYMRNGSAALGFQVVVSGRIDTKVGAERWIAVRGVVLAQELANLCVGAI
jgi:hypothetical protein